MRTHSGLISAVNNHFVKSGLIPKDTGRLLKRAEERRLTADYKGEAIELNDAQESPPMPFLAGTLAPPSANLQRCDPSSVLGRAQATEGLDAAFHTKGCRLFNEDQWFFASGDKESPAEVGQTGTFGLSKAHGDWL